MSSFELQSFFKIIAGNEKKIQSATTVPCKGIDIIFHYFNVFSGINCPECQTGGRDE